MGEEDWEKGKLMYISISKIQVDMDIANPESFRVKFWDSVPSDTVIIISYPYPGGTKSITMGKLRALVKTFEDILGEEQ